MTSSRPSRCQRTRCLRSATLATSEPASWFCTQHCASAAESRLVTVESPGGSSCRAGRSGSSASGTARACSRIARISWLRFKSAGRLKSRSASRSRRVRRLALGDGHQQIVAEARGAAAGSAAAPRLHAIRHRRRAISRLRRLSWCRPGSRRQRSSVGALGDRFDEVGQSPLRPRPFDRARPDDR